MKTYVFLIFVLICLGSLLMLCGLVHVGINMWCIGIGVILGDFIGEYFHNGSDE